MSNTHSEAGKGSTQRPTQTADEQVAQNWHTIFGKSRFERWKEEQEKLDKEKKDGQGL